MAAGISAILAGSIAATWVVVSVPISVDVKPPVNKEHLLIQNIEMKLPRKSNTYFGKQCQNNVDKTSFRHDVSALPKKEL